MRRRFKDCPWCGLGGKELEIDSDGTSEGDYYYHVWCWKCMARGPMARTVMGAIRLWNSGKKRRYWADR